MSKFQAIYSSQAGVLHKVGLDLDSFYRNTDLSELSEDEFRALESAMEHIDDAMRLLDYYAAEPKEGTLTLNAFGRYEVWGRELSCGNGLELLGTTPETEGQWFVGRVEHSDEFGGYYFCHSRHSVPLRPGLIVRYREVQRRS